MFKEVRRKDRELKNTEALSILKNGEYGVLSTIAADGYPYGVPVNYVYINDSIYFHCAIAGNKLDNIMQHPKVSFCVVGQTCILSEKFSTAYESVILFGEADEVFAAEKNTALLEFLNKYAAEYIPEGKVYIENASAKTKVIKINIEHIAAKARR